MPRIAHLAVAGAVVCASAAAAGLVDDAIVGIAATYLDGSWTVSNGSLTIPATVPGCV